MKSTNSAAVTADRAPLVQTAQKVGEVAIGRFGRRSLKGTAERGGNAGLRRVHVDMDGLTIDAAAPFRRAINFGFYIHGRWKRLVVRRSCFRAARVTVQLDA